MKKLIIGALISSLLIAGTVAFAHHTDNRVERLKEKLELNDEQATKITKIYQETQEKVHDLHQQIVESQKNASKQVSELLTAEQKVKMEELKENHKKFMKKRGHRWGRFPSSRRNHSYGQNGKHNGHSSFEEDYSHMEPETHLNEG